MKETTYPQQKAEAAKRMRLLGVEEEHILDCGPDILCPADTEYSLVVDVDVVIVGQIITDAPVSLIRGLVVDMLNDPCKLLILSCPPAYLAGGPFVVGCP